jgi:hypothetical protein
MSNSLKALLIVEGRGMEVDVFNRLSSVFKNLPFEIVPYQNNIHALYNRLKKDDFNVNIKDILREHANEEEEKILNQDFAYTYLIYDCDVHHAPKGDVRAFSSICSDNLRHLQEMAEYFADETDPTVGKLFINYPMMESLRDADCFFDANYKNAQIPIENKEAFTTYKMVTGRKKLANQRVDCWTIENFYDLILQNLFKLNQICYQTWQMPSYKQYRTIMDNHLVLKEEQETYMQSHILYVLNTSVLIPLEYTGESFFQKLITHNNS